MAPADSPSRLLPDKRLLVTRVNKKAIGLITLILASVLVLLLWTLMHRNSRGKEPVGGAPLKSGKAVSARPPESLTVMRPKAESQVEKTYGSSGVTQGSGAVGVSPELEKERAEFDREIRRFQHQSLLKRLGAADAALMAGMKAPGAEASGLYANGREGASGGFRADLGDPISGDVGGALGWGERGATSGPSDPNLQVRKETFLAQAKPSSYLPYQKEAPLSPFEVKQGTVIPALMITGINSDLPGQIIAQVSQNVFDSVTGQKLLIPQGTKIVGSYDSFVALGQERALVAWRRLIFPDGKSLELLNMAGADQAGFAGFSDQVNNHYLRTFTGAILLSLIGSGYQLSQPAQRVGDQVTANSIIAAQMGQQLSQVSGEMIRRNLDLQPTIEIRPGYRFNVMVNKDMILEPFEE